MQEKTRTENLQESNIEDLIYVCSSKRFDDPIHKQGIKLKKQWLNEMFDEHGSSAKIAYYDEEPVAQTLYYPEETGVTKAFRRENVLVINCIYNRIPEAQKLGIGTRLLESVIEDAKQRRTRLGDKPCDFILV